MVAPAARIRGARRNDKKEIGYVIVVEEKEEESC